jgi:NTP pyrophosphatase (non-canonical NTP hydrolase)
MTDHFNRLTPAEAERLALLSEEMGEAIQVIGKILRHGYESHHPGGGPTNRELLEKEIGDVRAAVVMMNEANDISSIAIDRHEILKMVNVRKYLHHQGT